MGYAGTASFFSLLVPLFQIRTGCIKYLLLLFAGSRLLAAVSIGLGLPLNVLPQILAQAYAIAMLRGNASLCSTQLMTDPSTIRRLRIIISLVSEMLLPTSHVKSLLAPGNECSFIFTFLHLVFGILFSSLPVILSATSLRARSLQGPNKFVISWIGVILCWGTAVLLTAYTVEGGHD